MAAHGVRYVSDEEGRTIEVIVPIELWREIESERETAYLLQSSAMERRLLEARKRDSGIAVDEAFEAAEKVGSPQ